MKGLFNKFLAVSLAIVVGLAMAGCSQSNQGDQKAKIEYPTKAIKIIHGGSAGGGSDGLAQLVKPFLEKKFGQQLVNEYKPAASGMIAWKEVSEITGEKADGYTITVCVTPKTQLTSLLNKDAGYTMDDFVGIANFVYDPGILAVSPDSQFKTAQELLDYAKANPGKVSVANSGDGSDDWFDAAMIEKLGGVKFNNVPFQGDGPSWQAAAGGHVNATSNNYGTISSLISGGKLRALAVYADKRLETLPDVPTLKELGIDYTGGAYRAFFAPKDTPAEIVEILADALEEASKDPEVIKNAQTMNLQIMFQRGDEFKTTLDKQNAQYKELVNEMNLSK